MYILKIYYLNEKNKYTLTVNFYGKQNDHTSQKTDVIKLIFLRLILIHFKYFVIIYKHLYKKNGTMMK